jgi:hypothetical protein
MVAEKEGRKEQERAAAAAAAMITSSNLAWAREGTGGCYSSVNLQDCKIIQP